MPNGEKKKYEEDLNAVREELVFQKEKEGKNAEELSIANKEIALQNKEQERCDDELIDAHKELFRNNAEKVKQAEEIRATSHELDIAEEKQEGYVENLKTMMFMTSHQLRSPIAIILGILDYLETFGLSKEEIQEMNKHLKSSAITLDNVTRELTSLIHDQEVKLKLKEKH